MFKPVPMMRLSAVVLARHERAVLRALGQMGAVQLTRTPSGEGTAPVNPPDRSRELARCDRLRARIDELRRSAGVSAGTSAGTGAMTFEEAERIVGEWEERIRTWAARRDQVQRRCHEVQVANEQVRPYSALDLPLDRAGAGSFLHFVTGTLPSGALERMPLAVNVTFLPLTSPVQGRQRFVALTSRSDQAALHEALKQAGFQPDPLPALAGGTTSRLFAEGLREEKLLQAQLDSLKHEGEALAAAAAGPLTDIEEWVCMERRLFEAEQLFPRTAASVLVTGWIPASDVPPVLEKLQAVTEGCCVVETTDPKDLRDDEIPVLLRPAPWLRPFQMLVTAYGLPKYRELAPTLFVAISYLLMFGMMFGDVGHGGLLVLAGAGLLWRRRRSEEHDAGFLLLANGLSSAAFGAVYGSYFGLPQLKKHALWQDPLEGDPMALMLLAMGVGVVLMSIGLGLNIINRLRHGEVVEGCLDKFGVTGLIFYWGALALVTQSAAIQAQGWWHVAVALFLAAPVVCWMIKEPLIFLRQPQTAPHAESGGFIGAVTESLVGAFEGVLLYLANTVSFVRLAAYAMSHAALLMATFTLADQVRGLAPGGRALGILVVILGNAVAIILEGIVAAVQALRLEYYEFFGKFFSGDGQPFRPFSLAAARPG